MQYEDRVVCFLDVLGFKEHIRGTQLPDGSDDEHRIGVIAEAIEAIREILDIDKTKAKGNRKEITQFSDCIVISFPIDEVSGVYDTLLGILWLQMALLRGQILCRGAIVRGKLIHTPKVLFGPALIEAHRLESSGTAKYPRVILDKSIIDIGATAHGKQHDGKFERKSIMKLLSKDSDEMYYIDYITRGQSELNNPERHYPGYLSFLQKIIVDGNKNPDESIREKYLWMKEKFSPYLADVKACVRTAGKIDKDLRFAYEAIEDI